MSFVGLIDVDGHHFPNLALMKISAWHKAQGDTVEWHEETLLKNYDVVYMSKIFSDAYSPDIPAPAVTKRMQRWTNNAICYAKSNHDFMSYQRSEYKNVMEIAETDWIDKLFDVI